MTAIETLLNNLETKGLFRYLPDADVPAAKAEIVAAFEKHGGEYTYEYMFHVCKRMFFLDAENVFEQGGLREQFVNMTEFFACLGIPIRIGAYEEQFGDFYYTKRRIKINGKIHDATGDADWGDAYNSALRMIDAILKENGLPDKCRPTSYDFVAILSDDLVEALDAITEPELLELRYHKLKPEQAIPESALGKIAAVKKHRLEALEFHEKELTAIPEQVFELHWLKSLVFGTWFDLEDQGVYSDGFIELDALPADIARLSQLESLILPGSPFGGNASLRIEDPDALAQLTELKHLVLSGPHIHDVSFLRRLHKLEKLDISKTSVTDLTPLAGLQNLRVLDLENCKATDLSPLAGLKQLQALDISGLRMLDLQPLSALNGLKKLRLEGAWVKDFSPLSQLSNLHTLDLRRCKPVDYHFLQQLPLLENLTHSFIKLPSLTIFNTLKKLREIDVCHTEAKNLDDLRDCCELEKLRLFGDFTDISGLAHCRKLHSIVLNGHFDDVTPLAGLPLLKNVYLYSPELKDYGCLGHLAGIRVNEGLEGGTKSPGR